CQRESNWPTF
nr:immunoglobulin light chain junction region [Macaca mulatta]